MKTDRTVQFRQRLLSLACRLTQTPDQASELVRRVFEHVHRDAPDPEQPSPCGTCLVRILQVLFINDCRSKNGLPGAPLPEPTSCGAMDCDGDDSGSVQEPACSSPWSRISIAHFARVVQALPDPDRQVYSLHVHGSSYHGIATELGLSVEDVSRGLRRTRQRLRALLEPLLRERPRTLDA